MKINKEFAKKMGYKEKDFYDINIQLTASKSKGKYTTTIVCPKNKAFKPFLIINKAKLLLQSKNINYEERLIDGVVWTRESLLKQVPFAKSVPQIFFNDEYIGGYEELAKVLQ